MRALLAPVIGLHRPPLAYAIGYIALAEREAIGSPKLHENPWFAGSTPLSLVLHSKSL